MPSGLLIGLASLLVSVLLWSLLTGRWSAESRRARKLQAETVHIHPLMHVPVPWVFVLVYLAGLGLQLLVPIDVRAVIAPGISGLVGFVLLGIGLVAAFSALGIFRKRSTTTVPFETPSTLVTWGPYRLSRNPMYLGLTLVYLGVAGTRVEIWPLIVLPLLLAYINSVVIPVEERRLHDVFGDAYRQYCATVRRWL